MKRKIFAVILCTSMLLTACSGKDDDSETTAAGDDTQQTETEQGGRQQADRFSLTYNGCEIVLNTTFDDIKADLGEEIRPSDLIPPCDGEGDDMTIYYFDGLDVGVDESGLINYASLNMGGEAAMAASTESGIKLGDPVDAVSAAYGAPEFDSEYVMQFFTDEDNFTFGIEAGQVSYIFLNQAG